MRVTDYGARVMAVLAQDRAGRLANVVLGFETPAEYQADTRYLGAIVGRYANRIANARFDLDGTAFRLVANEGRHHLHGGMRGFDRALWNAERLERNAIELRIISEDGDEGYPGNLDVRVTYAVTNSAELVVDYVAAADKATPVNLTQHSYFNLAGRGDVLDHVLAIDADAVTAVGTDLIPTGEIAPVAGTAYDFRSPAPIGARRAGDYDINYVLNRTAGPAARVVEPASGRTLEVRTTEPGLQLYSGSPARDGFCLETQHYPDSPNQPAFPSTILRPGAAYRSRTVFTFGVT